MPLIIFRKDSGFVSRFREISLPKPNVQAIYIIHACHRDNAYSESAERKALRVAVDNGRRREGGDEERCGKYEER